MQETKIYKVVLKSLYMDECENRTEVKVFTDEKLARQYYNSLVSDIKEQNDELDMEIYDEESTDNSYERYLSGRYFEDSICVSIEEDVICNEINLVKEDELDYEM